MVSGAVEVLFYPIKLRLRSCLYQLPIEQRLICDFPLPPCTGHRRTGSLIWSCTQGIATLDLALLHYLVTMSGPFDEGRGHIVVLSPPFFIKVFMKIKWRRQSRVNNLIQSEKHGALCLSRLKNLDSQSFLDKVQLTTYSTLSMGTLDIWYCS